MFVVKKRRGFKTPAPQSQIPKGIAWQGVKSPFAGLLCCSALTLSLVAQQAKALPGYEDAINDLCTNYGGVPSNPGSAGCVLCHDNGVNGPGEGRNQFAAKNLDYFCPIPDDGAGDDDPVGDDDDDDDDTPVGGGDDDTPVDDGDDDTPVDDDDDDDRTPVGDDDDEPTDDDDDGDDDVAANPGANVAPALGRIGAKSGAPGAAMSFEVDATDDNGDSLILVASDLPDGATFTDRGDGTGEFNWRPAADQVGTHDIIFTATDNGVPKYIDVEKVTFTIAAGGANQAPIFEPIGNKAGDIQTPLIFTVTAEDPDANNFTLSATGLPTGASFTDNRDGTGTFSWTPAANQIGTFPVTFTVTDDGSPVASTSEQINLVISQANLPPELARIGNQVVDPDDLLEFTVSATDADNDAVTITTTVLPGDAAFVENGDGSWTFSWTPTDADEGNHRVTFTATDNGVPVATDREEVVISVGDVNRPPELAEVGNRIVEVGRQLSLTLTATDPEADKITLTVDSAPAAATFVDNGDNTAQFIWTPQSGDIGSHSIAFTATDNGDPIETDAEEIIVTVTGVGGGGNSPPVLNPIGNQVVAVDATLDLTVTASDPDGDGLRFVSTNLPGGASLDDNGDGSAVLRFTPGAGDVGNHFVTVVVADNGVPSAAVEETFIVSVDDGNGVNLPPVLERVGFHLINAGETLTLNLKADDPDGDNVSIDVLGAPTGASVSSVSSGTATFTWTPSNNDVGFHPLAIVAQDDGTPVQGDAEFTFIEVLESEVEAEDNLVITQARIYEQNAGRPVISIKGVYNGTGSNDTVVITNTETRARVGTATMNGDGLWRLVERIDDQDVPCEITVSVGSESVETTVLGGCF